jgi:hypothetical protein
MATVLEMSNPTDVRVQYRVDAHGVFALPLYTREESAHIVEEIRKLTTWEDAEVVVEHDGETCHILAPQSRAAQTLDRGQAPEIHDDFELRVRSRVSPLIRQIWGVDLTESFGTQVIRYGPGGHYVPHTDAGIGELEDRYFTVLCYLNNDFEGGETRFLSLDFSAIPEPGKAIVFPSRYLHCAEPIIKGEKLALLTWICGPVPIRWI